MTNDIVLSKISENINNGTLLTSCQPTGQYSRSLSSVNNKPEISTVESKYDNRFDDPSYYYGGGASDGGFYSGADGGEL